MTPEELQKYKCDMVNALVKQIFQVIGEESAAHGDDFARECAMQLLRQYSGSLILNSLISPIEGLSDDVSAMQKFSLAWASYKQEKAAMQVAIGNGVSEAFQAWDPKRQSEFICQIRLVDTGNTDGKSTH